MMFALYGHPFSSYTWKALNNYVMGNMQRVVAAQLADFDDQQAA